MPTLFEANPDADSREPFFTALDEACTALWANPVAGTAAHAKRALFDRALADDLDENDFLASS